MCAERYAFTLLQSATNCCFSTSRLVMIRYSINIRIVNTRATLKRRVVMKITPPNALDFPIQKYMGSLRLIDIATLLHRVVRHQRALCAALAAGKQSDS